MRIMIKGGVWKNTEDEILKAAVMKYGKNQWARISSLLVRKSAKQCKARWYEWLDPSIKKTEWTREEDEKLLHLAKLMPTQWRTIAPIVGRTPSQCLERYEKLLDAVCVKDENYEPADDPRKLRPGEIDPNPESKPARPDPVDMDEDEKEMLSEARARLANTRGKKAKRKAREKQLEEARRLASLQKRRELKAAGIEGKQRRRKRKGIDYNAEIPFEKKPPPGFFDVSDEETRQVEQPNFPTTIEELEGKRRVDVEAQLRKQDVARNKIMQRHDAPSAVMQVNKLNDPEAVRKRAKLMLPSPQISDRELEEIAKMGYASDLVLGEDELAEGSGAARALLANYGQTPRLGMTPLRTPQRTPGGKGDAIMMEAENQARLRESQTPLFGGENPELHPSDFSGVTPQKREIQTPNPIATPLQTPGAVGLTPRIGMTPSREFSMTPRGTPIRDELHINEGMETPDSSKTESRRQAEIRRNLLAGLSDLPVPKNEYQIVVPELPTEDIEVGHQMDEDMSDKLARERAEEAARQAALLRKRSKVLQRGLPRPPISSVDFIKNSLTRVDDDKGPFAPTNFIEQADELIRKELVSLLEHDTAKYPFEEDSVKEKKKGSKGASNGRPQVPIPYIDDFDEEELNEATQLIEEEVSVLRVGMGHEDASLDDFSEAHDACLEDMMYFPGRNSYGLGSVASVTDKLAATQNNFENVRNHMESETRKAVRLEQKLKVLTQGYNMRAGKLWTQIEAAFKQADTSGTELECFRSLHKQEQLAASNRIEGLREAVNQQKEFERQLQLRYQNLLVDQDNLQRLLQEHKERLLQENKERLLREHEERLLQEHKETLLREQEERLLREHEERLLREQEERLLQEHKERFLREHEEKLLKEHEERLLREHEEKMAHLKESSKENAVDTQQSESAITEVDTSYIEGSNSEVQPCTISSKCNDVEMLDGGGIVEEKTDDNSLDMQIDHVPQSDGQNPVLEGEIVEQIPQQTKEAVQADAQNIVVQDEKIAVKDESIELSDRQPTDLFIQSNSQNLVFKDEDAEQVKQQCTSPVAQSDGQNYAIHNNNVGQVQNQQELPQSSISSQNDINKDADLIIQSNGQNPVVKDEDVEQVKQQCTSPVAQSDGQNYAIHIDNVGQVKNQQELPQSSISSQNDTNKDAAAVSVEMQHPIQNSTDGKNEAIHNENVGQVENQQELAQSSIYSENDMNKDAAAVSVEMQLPIQNSTDEQNDALHDESVGQVENQQELAQSSTNAQNYINKDAASVSVDMQHSIQNVDSDSSPRHLNDEFNGSDLLEQDVSAQTQQSVGDKTDIVMGVSKFTSQELVPLCKADTEGEIVVSIAETEQAVGDKTDIVMGVCKVISQEPVPLCKADTEGEIVVSITQGDTVAAHAEDVNLQS